MAPRICNKQTFSADDKQSESNDWNLRSSESKFGIHPAGSRWMMNSQSTNASYGKSERYNWDIESVVSDEGEIRVLAKNIVRWKDWGNWWTESILQFSLRMLVKVMITCSIFACVMRARGRMIILREDQQSWSWDFSGSGVVVSHATAVLSTTPVPCALPFDPFLRLPSFSSIAHDDYIPYFIGSLVHTPYLLTLGAFTCYSSIVFINLNQD